VKEKIIIIKYRFCKVILYSYYGNMTLYAFPVWMKVKKYYLWVTKRKGINKTTAYLRGELSVA